jgi:hypothetical protein
VTRASLPLRFPEMSRLLAILIPFVCVPALAPAAPAPPAADKPVYYFPTRVGTKWVYERSKEGEESRTFGKVVTESEEKDGRFLVTVKGDLKENPWASQYAVSKDGVFMVAHKFNNDDPYKMWDPPECLLKLPHKDGNTWETETDKLFRRKHVAKKIETIKVPAGTFEAIRVEAGGVTSWYAPEIGLVKQYDGTFLELKSFELPKK